MLENYLNILKGFRNCVNRYINYNLFFKLILFVNFIIFYNIFYLSFIIDSLAPGIGVKPLFKTPSTSKQIPAVLKYY